MITWREHFVRKIKWLLISRFVIFILIFSAVLILLPKQIMLNRLFIVYGVGTLSYLIALFMWEITRKEISFNFLCALQLCFEILVEAGIVHATGGIDSPFTIFFAFSILSSAFVFGFVGTLLVATFAVLAFNATLILEYHGILPTLSSLDAILYTDTELLFLRAFIFTCFLYAMAFLSGYLSGKLKTQIGEMEEVFSKFKRIKLDTEGILQHMKSGLITVNQEAKVIFYNQTAVEILDIHGETVKDKQIFEVLSENRLANIRQKFEKTLNTKTPHTNRSEIIIRNKLNNEIPLALVISNLYEDDLFQGAIAVFEDITSIKETEKHLREIEKMAAIGELSAHLAHEIRNPLASIRGSAEVLASDLNIENDNKKLMNLIIKETDRLSLILGEFLEFARIGEIPLKQFTQSTVNINKLIDAIIDELHNNPIFNGNIDISNQLGANEINVKGREDYLKNVFLNLLINSIEAIFPEKGEIIIQLAAEKRHLFSEGTMVGISVRDTGRGVSDNDKKEIFKPFYSTKVKGSGLGLAIAQRIVNQHQGYIEIGDNQPQGLVITVYLQKEVDK
ncbi:PAS domain S-box protein [bacterium]|nr:PAS domain S-box protein [bacterium]